MNKSTISRVTAEPKRDILFCTNPVVAIGVTVGVTGAADGPKGTKVIKAGQALQGTAGALLSRQTELVVATGAAEEGNTIYGVTQHDIVFDEGETSANANCIIFGFIDCQKMDPTVATVPSAIVTALDGKVTFLNGNVNQA